MSPHDMNINTLQDFFKDYLFFKDIELYQQYQSLQQLGEPQIWLGVSTISPLRNEISQHPSYPL